MNSRMNFGRCFSIPVQNGNQKKDYCNPVAPENPIPVRSNSTPIDMQGNHLGRSNWQDLLGIYSEILQGATNFTEAAVPNLNPIGLTNQNGCLCSRDSPAEKNSGFSLNGDSIVQHFGNDIGGGNGIHSQELLIMNHAASMTSANGLPHDKNSNTCNISVPMSYSQVESHWPDSNFARPSHANNIRASDYRINAHSLQQQMPKDGFQVPYQPNFNLNSPPRSETDAAERISTSFQHAAVTPEEGKQLENHQPSETPNFSVHESSYLEKGDQDKLIASIRNEATGNHCDELLQKIADSSAAAIYTTLEDNMNSQGGIELNKELQQKPPKRRKHRPKVVVEGKPQRTPKPTAPENTSNENPSGTRKYVRKKDLQASPTQQEDVMNEITVDKKASGKRKYVRKKGLQASATQHEDIMNEITVTNIKSEAKSCRIALNIELENETGDQGRDRNSSQVEMHQESRRSFNLNLDSQATDVCTGIYSASTKSALQIEQHNGYIAENQQARILRNFTHTANQMPAEYISLSEQIAAKAPPATMKDHTLNVIERNVNMRNADRCQSSSKNGYNQVHQHVPRRGKCQIVLQENTSTSLNKTRAQMLHSTTQLLAKDIANFDEQRGSNREHCQSTEQTYPRTVNFTGSSLLCQEMSDAGDYTNQGSNYGTGGSETRKKRKIDNKFHGTVLRMPSGNAAVKDCLQVGKRSITVVNSSSSTQIDGQSWKSYFEKDNASKKLNNGVNGAAGNSYFHSMAAEQNILKKHASSELHLSTRMEDKMSQQPTQAHDPNLLSATPPRKVPIADHLQGIETFHANMSTKNQSADPTSKQAPRKDKKLHFYPIVCSSAFMSLAAKFPLQSTSISHTRYLNGTTIVVEEPDIQLLGPGGTIKYQEKIARQPICSQSSVTSCEISEHRTDNLTSRTRVSSSANEHNMRAEENVSSSQISFDCFTFQATEDIRSSSGSNSEAVDQIGCKPNKNCSPTLNNFLQTEKTDAFEEFYSHVIGSPLSDERHLLEHQQSANPSCIRQNSRMGGSNNLNISSPFTCPIDSKISHMQGSAVPSINFWLSMLIESGAPEIEQFKESGEDNIFSLLSTASGNTKATGEYHADNRMGHMAESNIKHAAQQNKMSRLQASTAGPIASLSKRSSQGNLQSGSRSVNNQHSVKNHQEERFKSFHQESTSITEPLRRAEELAKRTTGSRQQLSVERRNSL